LVADEGAIKPGRHVPSLVKVQEEPEQTGREEVRRKEEEEDVEKGIQLPSP